MNFPENYFKGEVRCGFYVGAEMKRCWASTLEVLEDFAAVCNKYNLEWFAGFGTMLGAVRHEGFVPWDDDLDIWMKRPDYEKFLQVAEHELAPNYSILHYKNYADYDQYMCRILNLDAIPAQGEMLRKFHGFPYLTGIDVFVMDYISRDPEEDDFQQVVFKAVKGIRDALCIDGISEERRDELIGQLELLCNVKIDREKNLVQQAMMYSDKLMQLYGDADADELTLMGLWITGGTHAYPKECFSKAVWMPFENTFIKVPIGYRDVLMRTYGWFWEYARAWAVHNYPYYDINKQEIKEKLGISEPQYEFDLALWKGLRKEVRFGSENAGDRTIVFLSHTAGQWKYFAGIYQAAVRAGCKAYVVPLTDGTGYPDEAALSDGSSMDLADMHPDVIFFQYPYDAKVNAGEIDERFLAANLYDKTDCLVYIESFGMDDIYDGDERGKRWFRDFGLTDGVFYADYTYLPTEVMQKLYVDEWTKAAKGTTKKDWERRFRYLGDAAKDVKQEDAADCLHLPPEWEHKLKREDGSVRDAVLYYPAAGRTASEGDEMLRKISDTVAYFSKNENDTVVLWYRDALLDRYFEEERPDLLGAYQKNLKMFSELQRGILDETGNLKRACELSIAYIGDPGSCIPYFRRRRAPVMIQTEGMYIADTDALKEEHLYPGRGAVYQGRYFFYSIYYPGLYALDLASGETEYLCDLPERSSNGKTMYQDICEKDGILYIIPSWAKDVAVYDISRRKMGRLSFWDEDERKQNFYVTGSVLAGDYLILVHGQGENIFRLHIKTGEVDRRTEWAKNLKHPNISTCGVAEGEYAYFAMMQQESCIWIHVPSFNVRVCNAPNEGTQYYGICIHKNELCLGPLQHGQLVALDLERGLQQWNFNMLQVSRRGVQEYFRDIISVGDELWLVPIEGNHIIALDTATMEWREEMLGLSKEYLEKKDPGIGTAVMPCVFKHEEKIYITLYQHCQLYVYDMATKAGRTYSMRLPLDVMHQAKTWMLEYMMGDNANHPAYVEQSFFGVPEFLGNVRMLSEELKAQEDEHHAGSDIFNDVMRGRVR